MVRDRSMIVCGGATTTPLLSTVMIARGSGGFFAPWNGT